MRTRLPSCTDCRLYFFEVEGTLKREERTARLVSRHDCGSLSSRLYKIVATVPFVAIVAKRATEPEHGNG